MSDNYDIDVLSQEVDLLVARAPHLLGRALEGTVNDVSAYALRELATYPAARPESTYIRTMTLSRSWSRVIEGSGLDVRAIIGSNANMAPYNIYVQDEDNQATIHQGTWTNTVQAVVREYEMPAQRMFQARVEAEINTL